MSRKSYNDSEYVDEYDVDNDDFEIPPKVRRMRREKDNLQPKRKKQDRENYYYDYDLDYDSKR